STEPPSGAGGRRSRSVANQAPGDCAEPGSSWPGRSAPGETGARTTMTVLQPDPSMANAGRRLSVPCGVLFGLSSPGWTPLGDSTISAPGGGLKTNWDGAGRSKLT